MTYITMNGERRTKVTVTLTEDQLWDLDKLASAIDELYVATARTDRERDYLRANAEARPTSRPDALRWAINRALETIG